MSCAQFNLVRYMLLQLNAYVQIFLWIDYYYFVLLYACLDYDSSFLVWRVVSYLYYSVLEVKYNQILKINTNQWFILILIRTFTSTNVVVNQWMFHHHRHQYFVLILFIGVRLYTRNNLTRISILLQQSPNPLAKLLF